MYVCHNDRNLDRKYRYSACICLLACPGGRNNVKRNSFNILDHIPPSKSVSLTSARHERLDAVEARFLYIALFNALNCPYWSRTVQVDYQFEVLHLYFIFFFYDISLSMETVSFVEWTDWYAWMSQWPKRYIFFYLISLY